MSASAKLGPSQLQARIEQPTPSEIDMEDFIRRENLIIFRRRLGLAKDDAQRQLLLKLLAEEEKNPPSVTR
jgi:hypothetical protein